MRVVDRLAGREAGWNDLQALLRKLENNQGRRLDPHEVLKIGELYRSACSDLMLADAHDLPRETVAYLHSLVGRAHNVVYKTRGVRLRDWVGLVFDEVPRRLRADPWLRVSAFVFWGLFLLCAFTAAAQPGFATRTVGEAAIESAESSFEDRPGAGDEGIRRGEGEDVVMTGFYIRHNAGIGLSCYSWGLLLGVGSLWPLASNAVSLGTIFGHMATVPQSGNFFRFVTAHGPFELTAIVFAGAAGLRLGSGWFLTEGEARLASLRREAARSLPTAGVATLLFVLAAFIEGMISASGLPYTFKALLAIFCAGLLALYLFGLGRRPIEAARSAAPAPLDEGEATLGD